MKNILKSLLFLTVGSFAFAQQGSGIKPLKTVFTTVIDKNGKAVRTVEMAFQVLSDEGRMRLSLEKVRYSKVDQKFNLISAVSLTNGEAKIVKKSALKESSLSGAEYGMSDLIEVTIPFTNLQVGSEVRYKYQLTEESVIGNIFSDALMISNGSLAKEDESYHFESALPLKYDTENFENFYSLKESTKNGKYYIDIKPTPLAYALEGKKVVAGEFRVTTGRSWTEINQFLAPKYEQKLSEPLPPAFQTIADGAKKLSMPKEQIEYVGSELKKIITYSGDWTSVRGKWFPAGHNNVVSSGKGDCKDYSTSMVAILRAIQMTSNVALTMRTSRYLGPKRIAQLSELPNPGLFNHAIVWAKDKSGKEWWIDPTNPYVVADVISSDILGNFALILDNTSQKVAFLPIENADPSITLIEQDITAKADNTVVSEGKMAFSPSAYNVYGHLERQYGISVIKKVVASLINITSKDPQVEAQKSDDSKKPGYQFTMSASDWIQEKQGKFKAIKILNPAVITLMDMRADSDIYLGEIGKTTFVSRVLNLQAVDPIEHQCFVKSEWFDLERLVENRSNQILVSDTFVVKKRYLSKDQALKDEFKDAVGKLVDCLQDAAIVTFLDPSMKTVEQVALDKDKGPPVEKMTDEDAEKLQDSENLNLRSYFAKKLIAYYTKKLSANPKDAKALWKRAESKKDLGYISGDNYTPEYLQSGIEDLDKAILSADDSIAPFVIGARIRFAIFGKKYADAIALFPGLQKRAPNHFETYFSAYLLNDFQKKYDLAEKWLLLAAPVATTRTQKMYQAYRMSIIYENTHRYPEAIKALEELVAMTPNHPWRLHNLARMNLAIKNFDKTIELEKKALGIMNFGAASNILAMAYKEKFRSELNSFKTVSDARKPASISDSAVEEHILEAIKWNSKDEESYTLAAEFYLAKSTAAKNKSDLTKAKLFIEKALKLNPTNRQANMLYNLNKEKFSALEAAKDGA